MAAATVRRPMPGCGAINALWAGTLVGKSSTSRRLQSAAPRACASVALLYLAVKTCRGCREKSDCCRPGSQGGLWTAAMQELRLTRGSVTHTRPPELVSHAHRAIHFVRDFHVVHRIGPDATSRAYCVCEPTQNHTMPIRCSHSLVLPSDALTLSPPQLPIFSISSTGTSSDVRS